jgi:arylformamidase
LRLRFHINSKEYQVDTLNAVDISIPLIFDGDQPNIYDVDNASAKTFESDQFVGDTRRGGSCNFEEYKLITHCNGTHTECVGHISYERISIHNTLKDMFIPSTLITMNPEKAFDTKENYAR